MYLLLLIQHYGYWTGLQLYVRLKILGRGALQLPDLQKPVTFRPHTSDRHAFAQVFIQREYEVDYGAPLKYIVDAGANIGMATLYFKQRFPEAEVVAIEPHPRNAEAFRLHTSHLKNVRLYEAALHSRGSIEMHVTDEGFGSNGFMTRLDASEQSVATVRSITLEEIRQDMHWPHFDLVKLDIEGGEGALFEQGLDWMKHTTHIMLEFHERMVRGSSLPVIQAMAEHGFVLSQIRGENVLFTKLS